MLNATLIHSRHNPQLRHWRALVTDARARRKHGQTILDGVHLIDAALQAGVALEAVMVNELRQQQGEISALLERLAPPTKRFLISDALFGQISPVDQPTGIVAQLAIPPAPTTAAPDDAVSLVLDGVQDPGNLGTLLRTAAAAGVATVYCTHGAAQLWSPRVLRAGMGAHFKIARLQENLDPAQLAETLSGSILATTPDVAAPSLYASDLRVRPLVWLIGSEGSGLHPALAARAQTRVNIPMQAGVESLNVASATAVCLFEMLRQTSAAK